MLVWLIKAPLTKRESHKQIDVIMQQSVSMQYKSAAIRKLDTWDDVSKKLFGVN